MTDCTEASQLYYLYDAHVKLEGAKNVQLTVI